MKCYGLLEVTDNHSKEQRSMIEYPSSPEEITEDWLRDALTDEKEELVIEDISASGEYSMGDYIMSHIIRAKVKGKRLGDPFNQSLVIKVAPPPRWQRKMLMHMRLFHREVEAYTKLLPDMIQVQKQKRKYYPSIPRCYFASVNHNRGDGVLILEDLTEDEFRTVDPKEELDIHHCRLVMVELAKFHALGYKVKLTKQDELKRNFPEMTGDLWASIKTVKVPIMRKALILISSLLKTLPEKENHNFRLNRSFEHLMNEMFEGLITREPYATFCHGDLSSNNLMFKYDKATGKPIQVQFLDFQMCHYGQPATDLAHFFFTSASRDLRTHRLRGLLNHYNSALFECLGNMEVVNFVRKDYPLETLWRQFQNSGLAIGLIQGFIELPITLLPEDVMEENYLCSEDEEESMKKLEKAIRDNVLSQEHVQKRLVDLVDDALATGLI